MIVHRNVFLYRRFQCLFTLVFGSLLFYCFRSFNHYSSLPIYDIRFGQPFFYCVIIDRIIAVLVFLLKVTLACDPHVSTPFTNGSFDAESNDVLKWIWLGISVSNLVVFAIHRVYPRLSLISQLVWMTIISVAVIWIRYYLKMSEESKEDKKHQLKRVFLGTNEVMNRPSEKRAVNSLGYFVNDLIGSGVFGTSYRCSRGSEPDHYVLKVIDISEWHRNKNRKTNEATIIDTTRTEFIRNQSKLLSLNNENVVKYEKIVNKQENFALIYMITKMADMNLDTFLSKHKPYGVPEEWAREWFTQLCKGLKYLHEFFDSEPIGHSDIKPENILLYPKSDQSVDLGYSNLDRLLFRKAVQKTDPKKALEESQKKNDIKTDLRNGYILKLSDGAIDSFLPLKGKVFTKKDPTIVISPPKNLFGKRNLRIQSDDYTPDDKKSDDIYQMAVILILLLKGDIKRLMRDPKDTERIHKYVTGVDAFYIRFDTPLIMKELFQNCSKDLQSLLRKMMEREPCLRYDIKQVMESEWMGCEPQNTFL